jgi:hypothetical protein
MVKNKIMSNRAEGLILLKGVDLMRTYDRLWLKAVCSPNEIFVANQSFHVTIKEDQPVQNRDRICFPPILLSPDSPDACLHLQWHH